MAIIDIHTSIVSYGDADTATTNPQRRFMDWSRHVTGIVVSQPSIKEYIAQPGEVLNVFSGQRSTSIDNTSAFAITLNPVKASVYRITNTGGTLPVFRTVRAYNPTGLLHTLVVNNNATLEMTSAGAFTGAVVGDWLFIPGATTGDPASPFNANNTGVWVVLAVMGGGTKLVLGRRVGEAFNGVAESVTPVSASQLVLFSASGVQVGDNLEISAGFSVVTQKTFVVSEVTDKWVEFTSTENLPLETAITPGNAGMSFYTDSKRFIRVEVDQEAVLRLNGDSGNTNRLSPLVSGDANSVAHFEKWGPAWSLTVVNRSTVSPMVITVLSVE